MIKRGWQNVIISYITLRPLNAIIRHPSYLYGEKRERERKKKDRDKEDHVEWMLARPASLANVV